MPADKRDVIYTAYQGHIAQWQSDFESRARTEASQHLPPTGRTSLDGNETELLAEADRCNAGEQRILEGKLADPSRHANEVRARLVALRNMPDEQSVVTELDGDLEQLLNKEKATQVDCVERRMRRETDLRHFCTVNRITSPATYPLSRLNHIALVLVSILAESLANTFFYKNDSGLLGGFVVAISVSILNIGSAFLLGLGFRYKNLTDRLYKSLGWSCVGGFVALTLYFNALFASFRSEYQAVLDSTDAGAMRDAFTHAMNQAVRIFILDTSLSDFQSFVLFGIGIMLSAFAFYKGYTFDDRYPGYGDKDRRYREELESERQHVEQLRDALAAQIARHRANAQRYSQEPRELVGVTAKKRAEVALAIGGVEHQFRAIRRDFHQVISAYRNANRAIRQAEPPAYWATLPEPTVALDLGAGQALLAELDGLGTELNALVESATTYANGLLRTLGERGKRFMDVTFAAYLGTCEADAQERLNRSAPGVHSMGVSK